MEPTSPSEDAEGQAIVRVLATVLERLVQANSTIEVEATAPPQEQTHFHAQRAPAIGILAYLERYVLFIYGCAFVLLISYCILTALFLSRFSLFLYPQSSCPTHISPTSTTHIITITAYTNMHPVPRNVSS